MVRNALLLIASLQITNLSLVTARRPLCNKVGWASGHDSFISTYAGSYTECSDACSKHRKCKSFAYSSDDCQIFNVPVKGNYAHDKDSPYTFYDVACEESAQPTARVQLTSSAQLTESALPSVQSAQPTASAQLTEAAQVSTMEGAQATATTSVSPATSSTQAIDDAQATASPELVCDELGYFIGDDKYSLDIIAYWGHPNSERTKLACYNDCLKEAPCLSYAWNEGACSLFSTTLAGNFNYSADSVADFYDMACGAPPATTDDILSSAAASTSLAAATSDDPAMSTAAASTTADVAAMTTGAPAAASTSDSAASFMDASDATTTDGSAASATTAPGSEVLTESAAESAAATTTISTETPLEYISTTPAPTATDAASTDSIAAATTYTGFPDIHIGTPIQSTDSISTSNDTLEDDDTAAATSVVAEDAAATSYAAAATSIDSSNDAAATTASAQKLRRYFPRRVADMR